MDSETDLSAAFISLSDKKLSEIVNDPKLFHYTGLVYRPGVKLFSVILEFGYYPPKTPANEKLQIMTVDWRDTPWLVCSIPKDEFENAETVCRQTGLRAINSVPRMLLNREIATFPINTKSLFTLENEANSLVHQNFVPTELFSRVEHDLMLKIFTEKINPADVNFTAQLKKTSH